VEGQDEIGHGGSPWVRCLQCSMVEVAGASRGCAEFWMPAEGNNLHAPRVHRNYQSDGAVVSYWIADATGA
jgi:hypothetical protein